MSSTSARKAAISSRINLRLVSDSAVWGGERDGEILDAAVDGAACDEGGSEEIGIDVPPPELVIVVNCSCDRCRS